MVQILMWNWNHLVSLDCVSCSLLLKVIFCILELIIHRIELQSYSNVCTANGFLSCCGGSHGAVVLWSLDVSAVAVRESKLVEESASRSLKSYLQST